MEDFGSAAVGLVEDLLVNFPSRLGDVHPPFAEFGVLQVVVHFIFLPRWFCSRSVLLRTSQNRPAASRGVGWRVRQSRLFIVFMKMPMFTSA
jgi:hypothetical protein